MTAEQQAAPVKVLIIDDDILMRVMAKKALRPLGCVLIEAENGLDGMQQFRQYRPHIVISDLLMPDKEGLETISEIHALSPGTKIVAMSGGGTQQNLSFLNMAKHVGADTVLIKPFKAEDLLAAVRGLWPEKT